MFLGYQNDKIAFVAETKEELENLPCVVLERIEETDKEYFLHNGEYVTEAPAPTTEEIRQQREAYYKEHCDPLTCEKIRKTALGEWTVADEEIYVERMVEIKEEVQRLYPYPEE